MEHWRLPSCCVSALPPWEINAIISLGDLFQNVWPISSERANYSRLRLPQNRNALGQALCSCPVYSVCATCSDHPLSVSRLNPHSILLSYSTHDKLRIQYLGFAKIVLTLPAPPLRVLLCVCNAQHKNTPQTLHAHAPQPLSPTPLPTRHPHIEVFHFDTIEEADEFRKRAHMIQRKYHPERNVMHRKHMYVTSDDLQSFQSILANEITKIRSGIALKRCHVRIELVLVHVLDRRSCTTVRCD